MKFSIVTPSYNQAEFIADTLKSVQAQSYTDVEHIVIDGGSSDETDKVVRKFRNDLKVYLSEKDDGQTDAINKGFRYADGDIYAYLNSDDYYLGHTLEVVAKAFQENPDIDIIYGDCVFVDREGQFLRYFSEISDFDKDRLLSNTNHIMQPATFWRRSVFDKFGPFDKTLHFGFDWALWCEFAFNNCRFLRINEVLAANRVYGSTKTSSGGGQRLKELRDINNKYKTTFFPHASYCFYREEYAARGKKNLLDYLQLAKYTLLSYQSALYYYKNYNKKIINGLLPKTDLLMRRSRLVLPRLDFAVINITLRSPERINQKVKVFSNNRYQGEYSFVSGLLSIAFDLDSDSFDVDVRFEFLHEYDYPENMFLRSFQHYKATRISAAMESVRML